MTKKIYPFHILILLISLGLFLISCSPDIEINTKYSYNNADEYKVGNASFDASIIKHVDIDWLVGNIIVDKATDDKISFSENADESLSEDLKLHYYQTGNTLYIKFAKSTNKLSFTSGKKDLYVKIPGNINLDSFYCNMVSANITLKNTNADNIHIDSVSGTIYSYNSNSRIVKFETTSGNIKVKGLEAIELQVLSTSGNITYESIKSSSVLSDTTSGSITGSDLQTESFVTFTSSGDVDSSFQTTPLIINVETISSDIKLTLPEDSKFMMDYDTVSGSLMSDFEFVSNDTILSDYTTIDPSSKFSFETVSGDLKLLYKK